MILEFGKLLSVGIEEIGELVHDGGAFGGGEILPRWEGSLCSVDGVVDILLRGNLNHIGDDAVVGRIVDCKGGIGRGRDVLSKPVSSCNQIEGDIVEA